VEVFEFVQPAYVGRIRQAGPEEFHRDPPSASLSQAQTFLQLSLVLLTVIDKTICSPMVDREPRFVHG
jgi:hypothetical protein